MWDTSVVTAIVALAVGAVGAAGVAAQGTTTRGAAPPDITAGGQTNWTSHNLDLANSRYSALDEVDTGNVGRLTELWSVAVPAGVNVGQVTPLVVDGLMYFHAGANVTAVDATTGESVWTLELDSARQARSRGPTYAEGKIYAYTGPNLVAVDARTGELVESYGDGGVLPVVAMALQAKYPDAYPPDLDPHNIEPLAKLLRLAAWRRRQYSWRTPTCLGLGDGVSALGSRRLAERWNRAVSTCPTERRDTVGERRPAGTVERCRRCAGYDTRRTSWSAVSASTPNMQWHITLAAPRTRTWRPPNSSLRRPLTRSPAVRSL